MEDLVEWLRLQLDEVERIAREATQGPWRWVDPGGRTKQALVAGPDPWQMIAPISQGDAFPSKYDAEHIALHDPDRVLREVEAKRQRIKWALNYWQAGKDEEGPLLMLAQVARQALQLESFPYAGRPGYRDEWWPSILDSERPGYREEWAAVRTEADVFVQWKGTVVCLDLYCKCGYQGHFDGDFAYHLRCGGCGRIYVMPHTFALEEVEGDDGNATQDVFDGAGHPPRDGPAEVTVT